MVYEARLFTGSRIYKFTTRLLQEGIRPLDCYFLEYPRFVSQVIWRRNLWVRTSIVGKLRINEYHRSTIDVLVETLSTSRIGISLKEDVLLIGQTADFTMDLSINARSRPVSLTVQVRNRRKESDRRIRYELEFVRIPDEVWRRIKDYVVECVASA